MVKVYFNGQLKATDNTCVFGTLQPSTDPLVIGRELPDGSGTPHYFQGQIDEPRVYDRALTDSEIAALPDNFPLTVFAPGLLANDTDADGNVLFVQPASSPAHGVWIPNLNGSFTYAPDAGFFGTDTFSYNPSDGQQLSTTAATVTIDVTPNLAEPINVAVGARPLGVGIDTNTHRGFVANYNSNTVSVLDVDKTSVTFGQLLATVAGVSHPVGVGVNPVTHRVYVTEDGGNVKVIDSNPASATYATILATVGVSDASDDRSRSVYKQDFRRSRRGLFPSVIDGATNTSTSAGVNSARPGRHDGQSGDAPGTSEQRCGGIRVIDGDPASPTYLQAVVPNFDRGVLVEGFGIDPSANNTIYVGVITNPVEWFRHRRRRNELLRELAIAGARRHRAISSATKLVYAAGPDGGNLYVIDGDPASGTYGVILSAVAVGSSTYGVAVDPAVGIVIVTGDGEWIRHDHGGQETVMKGLDSYGKRGTGMNRAVRRRYASSRPFRRGRRRERNGSGNRSLNGSVIAVGRCRRRQQGRHRERKRPDLEGVAHHRHDGRFRSPLHRQAICPLNVYDAQDVFLVSGAATVAEGGSVTITLEVEP